jgi:uncharacterized protein (TIGR02996 family)
MVIVVAHHDAGWKDHVVIERETFTIGRYVRGEFHGYDLFLDAPELEAGPMTLAVQEVRGALRLGDTTLEVERYDDPAEAALLAASVRDDDASRLVYADWLEQRGQPARAELLRAQIEILRWPWREPAFVAWSARLRELESAVPYGWRKYLERPVIELGDRARFAFRIGLADQQYREQRVVQIWAAGIELTCDDDKVYVPAYSYAMSSASTKIAYRPALPYPELDPAENHRWIHVLDGDLAHQRERHGWLHCGPTTDNITSYLFGDGDDAIFTFAFWRSEHPRPHELGQVFVVRLPARVLEGQIRELLEVLKRGI